MSPDERADSPQAARALLEHYLKIIAFWLPRAQRRDVVLELEGEIRAQVEEEERELGRALTEPEMEALLERWGHPMQVAGRYLPRRHLIGPEVFPLYLLALKVVALVYLVPWFLVWLGLVLFSDAYRARHPGWELLGTLSTSWSMALSGFGVTTLLFALFERSRARNSLLLEWNPRRRPPERDPLAIPRSSSAVDLVVQIVFLAWWLRPWLPSSPELDPALMAGARSVLLDLHGRLFLPVVLLAFARAALAVVNLIRPQWTRARLAIRAALQGVYALVLFATLAALPGVEPALAQLRAAKIAGSEADGITSLTQICVYAVTLVLACVFTGSCLLAAFRAVRWKNMSLRAAAS